RVAGIDVRAVVEQLADGLRVRISDRREQVGCDRPWLTLAAGLDRARRRRWGPGPTSGQENRDSNAGEQNNRDSQARETLVTFPTTHDATPLRDGEMLGPRGLRRGADRLSIARSGSTGRHLETGANPLLMSNGKVGRSGASWRDLRPVRRFLR